MADPRHIVDVTTENYDQLIEASFEVPVLIDFWADWCQPCRVLMPVLAKLADEYGGRFLLGKLNTEEQREIAARFGIRSIPTVKLFRDGQPVDEFMGALPERAVRAFLDRHVARASDADVAAALERLHTGDTDAAIALLNGALEADPDNPRVLLGLAEAHAAAGDVAAAGTALDALPPGEQDKPAVVALRGRLYFQGEIVNAPPAAELEARLAADPSDHDARYKLALHDVVAGDYEAAVEHLFALIRGDRSYGDDAGRRVLLKVLDLMGDDPRVGQFRRRMASLLH